MVRAAITPRLRTPPPGEGTLGKVSAARMAESERGALNPLVMSDGSKGTVARTYLVFPRFAVRGAERTTQLMLNILPPRRQLPVRPEHDRVQSCAIALRSPASERSFQGGGPKRA
eukprot:scaffold45335_cov51-Phaeocystis_antarctica.AAC.1